jgi:hypothetical protein
MLKLRAILVILPILVMIIPISYAQQSSSRTVLNYYSGYSQSSPLGSSTSPYGPYSLSPAGNVNAYNTQNALWLISCPSNPSSHSSQNPLLYTSTASSGNWLIAGDACQAPSSPSDYPVTGELTAYPPQSPGASGLYGVGNAIFSLYGAVYASINNIGYSPELIDNGNTIISSSFDTNSYLFNGDRVDGQHGVWSWNAIYLDLGNPGVSQQFQGLTVKGTEQGVYTTQLSSPPPSGGGGTSGHQASCQAGSCSVSGCPGLYVWSCNNPTGSAECGSNGGCTQGAPTAEVCQPTNPSCLSASTNLAVPPQSRAESFAQQSQPAQQLAPLTCSYSYTYNYQVTLDGVSNQQIQFPAPSGGTSGVNLFPYLVYSANVTNSAPGNQFNYPLSYDIYSPQNYQDPAAKIDPIPLDSQGMLLANALAQDCTTKSCAQSATSSATQLSYFPASGPFVTLTSPQNVLGTQVPEPSGQPSLISCTGSQCTSPPPISNGQCPSTPDLPYHTSSLSSDMLSVQAAYDCAVAAGFPEGISAQIIVAISMAESGMQPGRLQPTGNGCDDNLYLTQPSQTHCGQGIVQIDSGANPQVSQSDAFTASYSFSWAYSESGGTNFNAWCTYAPSACGGNGDNAYCQYMPSSYSVPTCPNGGGAAGDSFWAGVNLQPTAPTAIASPIQSQNTAQQQPTSAGYTGDTGSANTASIRPQPTEAPSSGSFQDLQDPILAGTVTPPTIPVTAAGGVQMQIDPQSIASIPSGYIFVLGTNPSALSMAPASSYPSAQQQQYQSALEQYGMNIYVLKVIPSGELNTSLYQPNSLVQSNTISGFNNEWSGYWSNVINMQQQSLYVINVISANALPFKYSWVSQTSASSGAPIIASSNQFSPYNISVDSFGDVFITGQDSSPKQNTWVMEITNTIGNGPITENAVPACPNQFDSRMVSPTYDNYPYPPSQACTNGQTWSEIAVSPTGSEVFLADHYDGHILTYDQNLKYSGIISLNYSTSNVLYFNPQSLEEAGATGNPLPAPPSNAPELNITDFLANGGLYGITTKCGSSHEQACTPADANMIKIINAEEANLKSQASGCSGIILFAGTCTVDVMDKVDWAATGNNNYHHPLGIEDVNGYLYVLDNWYGVSGQVCSKASLPIVGSYSSGCTGGIRFNMLVLRIINSSGVDVPVDPTYYNDLWTYNPSHTATYKYTQASSNYYPPYGWILSATVGYNCPSCGPFDPSSHVISLCSGGFIPTSSPTYQSGTVDGCISSPEPDYPGTLKPLGPMIRVWNSGSSFFGLLHYRSGPYPVVGVSFSVNYNNTMALYVPSVAKIQQTWHQSDGFGSTQPYTNMQGELLIANLAPQNYTKSIGGSTYPRFVDHVTAQCYTGNYIAFGFSATYSDWNYGLGSDCQNSPAVMSEVDNLNPPVYVVPNPFKYDSNIGSFQTFTLDTTYSSSGITSGLGSYSGGGAPTQAGVESELSGISGAFASSAQSNAQQFVNYLNNPNLPAYGLSGIATSINSIVSGYLVMPYSYTYTYSYSYSNPQPITTGASANPPGCPTTVALPPGGSEQFTVYNYTTSEQTAPQAVSPTQSNARLAQLESGQTYAKSGMNTSFYYDANLSSVTVPQQILYNILTNRVFGAIYVNSSVSPTTNYQAIVNATYLFTYNSMDLKQGRNPGFEYFVANSVPSQCVKPSCDPFLTNTQNVYGVNNIFTANAATPLLVQLFNWEKIPVNDLAIQVAFNGISPPKYINVYPSPFTFAPYPLYAYGYHRLDFVYNDRFGNTYYMPLDADIANITAINLNVYEDVNSINSNQTLLVVNGTAGWTNPISQSFIPLKNQPVYLYYQANLDTIGYNAVTHPVQATQCIFSVNGLYTGADTCQLANPSFNALAANSLYPGQINPNVITYNTAFNSMRECPPAANSLFTPVNQIYTICNIYPDVASAMSATSPTRIYNQCPALNGNTQYCYPLYQNGTGVCTPQMGLFDIATTNAMGYFSDNVVACGSGSADVFAQYYGAPGNEPIQVKQSPLSDAANPQSTQYTTFNAFNYAWAPIESAQIVEIGALLLSTGNISALPIAAALAAIAAIMLFASRRRAQPKPRRTAPARRRRA